MTSYSIGGMTSYILLRIFYSTLATWNGNHEIHLEIEDDLYKKIKIKMCFTNFFHPMWQVQHKKICKINFLIFIFATVGIIHGYTESKESQILVNFSTTTFIFCQKIGSPFFQIFWLYCCLIIPHS